MTTFCETISLIVSQKSSVAEAATTVQQPAIAEAGEKAPTPAEPDFLSAKSVAESSSPAPTPAEESDDDDDVQPDSRKKEEEVKIADDFYYTFDDHVSRAKVTSDSGLPTDWMKLQYPFCCKIHNGSMLFCLISISSRMNAFSQENFSIRYT